MSQKVTQKQVNQKCDLLKSQNEEITVNKIRKLIGGNISIIDLVEKVTLYKESKSQAIKSANTENESVVSNRKDELVELLENVFTEFYVDKKDLVMSLRNRLTEYVEAKVNNKIQGYKDLNARLNTKISDLELNSIVINKRHQQILEKIELLKNENYLLKQNYDKYKYSKIDEQEPDYLPIEDFKPLKEQLKVLKNNSMLACYDMATKNLVIKFPATNPLTQACRSGNSFSLKAKGNFNFDLNVWELYDYRLETLEYLRKRRFKFSQELETVNNELKKFMLDKSDK